VKMKLRPPIVLEKMRCKRILEISDKPQRSRIKFRKRYIFSLGVVLVGGLVA
jgi:hypothetical protein